MKRYVQEMANDIQREVNKEIKAMNIPFGQLAEIGKAINIIVKEYKNYMLTDRDAVSALLVAWDQLKQLQWENA